MITVFTIGYEGANLSDFLATLTGAGVQRVVDVRDRAQSRRPGFSKKALQLALETVSIEYEHRKPLGDPKPGRDAARAGEMDKFRAIFSEHMQQEEPQAELKTLAETVKKDVCALLCYERNPHECHRKLLCNDLGQLISISVQHLGVHPVRKQGDIGDGAHGHAGAR